MATPCEEEAMEVEPNPGESMQMSDLNVVINGENNKYITRNIFRTIFFKKNSEIPIFQSIQKVSLFGRCRHHRNHHCCYLSVNNSFPWPM